MEQVGEEGALEVIDSDECVALLATEQVGRVGFSSGAATEVLPVNFALDGNAVVFTTGVGTKLWSIERGPVTFEVDHTDPATRSGWSVVVHGDAHVVSPLESPKVLDRLQRLDIKPWAHGDKPHLVRITAHTITGRRIRA